MRVLVLLIDTGYQNLPTQQIIVIKVQIFGKTIKLKIRYQIKFTLLHKTKNKSSTIKLNNTQCLLFTLIITALM